MELSDSQVDWLLQQACDQWSSCYGSLSTWRGKMTKWEHMSEGDYSDRVGRPDPNNTESVKDVFSVQNESIGMSEGFVDFATAQGRDDIFGTWPWLKAGPIGRADGTLADLITKHATWKLDQSDLEPALRDAISIACWGGTVFVKTRWDRQVETSKRLVTVAISKSKNAPFTNPQTKDFIKSEEEAAAAKLDGNDLEWRRTLVEETTVHYDNTRTNCIDFKDIAFDSAAPHLDLAFTNVFCRFRMGLLDVMDLYKIPTDRLNQLKAACATNGEGIRSERGESNTDTASIDEDSANPPISLIDGYMRLDPLGTGKPVRIHCVFAPELQILFRADYLKNVTPDGVLPVFPVRVAKIPGRILGRGYFEKYEMSNDSVDRQHNSITRRNKLASEVIAAVQPAALLDPEPKNYVLDTSKPVVLGVDKKIEDFVQFATIPDSNSRAVELMNTQLQMAQMRSGITSAAQGELKGVPNASTATGVNQLTSRGALLLKDPITQLTDDIERVAGFNVDLVYANQDRDETFAWGDGEASELLTIKAGDVRGLRMNVSLRLVQAQNQSKLANAQAATQALASYIALPEMEKAAARPLFIDQITALGYNNAEDIIRQAIADPAGIIALLPPEIAPIVAQALTDAGVMAPATGLDNVDSAPVTEAT
ncbi:hypothetical protein GCM10023212_05300 [Luteolibacter yonseiensis]